MAFADGSSVPLDLHTESASPHEVSLVEATLQSSFLKEKPDRLVGDKAYDSDPLDERLKEQGIEMIAPHRRNRKKKKTQDGRKLRRYKRRWNIERLFAWLQNLYASCQVCKSPVQLHPSPLLTWRPVAAVRPSVPPFDLASPRTRR